MTSGEAAFIGGCELPQWIPDSEDSTCRKYQVAPKDLGSGFSKWFLSHLSLGNVSSHPKAQCTRDGIQVLGAAAGLSQQTQR